VNETDFISEKTVNKRLFFLLSLSFMIVLTLKFPVQCSEADDEKILQAIENIYTDYSVGLMTGDWHKSYDMLADLIRKRVKYDGFVTANQMMMKSFMLKASQLSSLRVRGKYAAARALTYIDFYPEKEGDSILNGKIEALVFFILEKGSWKIATGTDEDIEEFLRANPKAREIMPPVKTRIYYKQKGYWIAFDYHIKEDQKLTVPK
jgi:hypothetical protein